MRGYKAALPEVFPVGVNTTPEMVRAYVEVLLDRDRKDLPQGSSFAITVDGSNGTWNIWLSQASLDCLKQYWPELGGLER